MNYADMSRQYTSNGKNKSIQSNAAYFEKYAFA